MEQSFIVGGKQFLFSSISGTVLSENRKDKLHLSANVSTDQFGTQTKISSHTTTDQEIWIKRDDNGKEFLIRLSGDIPLREGQRLTAVNISCNNLAYWAFLYNETTSTGHQLMNKVGFLSSYFRNTLGCLAISAAFVLFALFLIVLPYLIILAPIPLLLIIVVVIAIRRIRNGALFEKSLGQFIKTLGF
jgi:hypothetical protein